MKNPIKKVTTQELIRIETVIGSGKQDNPFERGVQFYTKEGIMIATIPINDLKEYQKL